MSNKYDLYSTFMLVKLLGDEVEKIIDTATDKKKGVLCTMFGIASHSGKAHKYATELKKPQHLNIQEEGFFHIINAVVEKLKNDKPDGTDQIQNYVDSMNKYIEVAKEEGALKKMFGAVYTPSSMAKQIKIAKRLGPAPFKS